MKTIVEDDGSLERSVTGDHGARALIVKSYFRAWRHKNPYYGLMATERLADRLEGKPIQVTEERNPPVIEVHLGPDDDDTTPGSNRAPNSKR